MTARVYSYRRSDQIKLVGLFLALSVGLAAFSVWPDGDTATGVDRILVPINPYLSAACALLALRYTVEALRGPVRVTDELVYNPTAWRRAIRHVRWTEVEGVAVEPMPIKPDYQRVVLELRDGRRSIVGLGWLWNPDGLVTDLRETFERQAA